MRAAYEKGYVFGPLGLEQQPDPRHAEIGFMFGNNIMEKKP